MAKARLFYAFRCVRSNPCIKCLVEINGKRQLAEAMADARYTYEIVDGLTAHEWVRNGLLHEAALYVADNDRIRRDVAQRRRSEAARGDDTL